jgi:3-hydroxyisobutyrate dehydrogenase
MRVGYIGLGNMGKPMASHLAPAGLETTVFDLAPGPVKALVETGAKAASSASEVARASDVLCLCVPADSHVRSVLLGDGSAPGALEHLQKGAVVAIHSTVTAETIVELAAEATARGCSLIDASVTGGERLALAGELIFLVGGDDAAVEKVRPVLDASSKLIIHAGPLGSGAKLKLAVNALTYVHFAGVREAYSLAKASGIDPKLWIEATRANGQLSDMEMSFLGSFDLPPEALASEAYQNAMGVQVFNAEKDLAHALALARQCGISMPTSGLVAQGMARIYGVDDPGRR